MSKYIRITAILIRMNLMKEFMYRINVLGTAVAASSYVLTYVLTLNFTFDYIDGVAGFNYHELLTLLILAQIWWYLNMIFVRKTFQFIAKAINAGELDMFIVKPFSFRSYFPFLQFDFRHIPPFVIMSAALLVHLHLTQMALWQLVGMVVFMANSTLIVYSLTSIWVASNFWFGRNMSIFDITIEMPELMKIPYELFPFAFKILFTIGLPILITISPVFQIIYNKIDPILLLLSILMSLILFLVSEFIWHLGLKSYTSAN